MPCYVESGPNSSRHERGRTSSRSTPSVHGKAANGGPKLTKKGRVYRQSAVETQGGGGGGAQNKRNRLKRQLDDTSRSLTTKNVSQIVEGRLLESSRSYWTEREEERGRPA